MTTRLTEADTLANREYPAKLRSPCVAIPSVFAIGDPLHFRYRMTSIVNGGTTHLIEEFSPFDGSHRAVAADTLEEALAAADANNWTPVVHTNQPSTQ